MGLRIVMLPHWKAPRLVIKLPLPRMAALESIDTDKTRCSDINWVIMDYLVSEGYPGAAEKFAQETNLPSPVDNDSIRDRVRVRNAIHSGKVKEAIQMVNEIDPDVSLHVISLPHQPFEMIKEVSCTTHIRLFGGDVDAHSPDTSVLSMISATTAPLVTPLSSSSGGTLTSHVLSQILDLDHLLHFHLLQLQLIEIIRDILAKPGGNPAAQDFRPAIEFATTQLAPRAPTNPAYQQALERTMALMIFPPEKMGPEFKELLDVRLREKVAGDVNRAILESRGERSEAKIRQLIKARAWAETEARSAKVDLPSYVPIGLDAADEVNGGANAADGDAMMS